MSIISKYKIAFIHIPKTGGNTVMSMFHQVPVQESLKSNQIKNLQKYYKISHKKYNREELYSLKESGFLPFATVRNPYQRAYSMFQWDHHHTSKRDKRTPCPDFKSWLLNIPNCNLFLPQSVWITDYRGLLPIKLCKIENIQKEIKPICEHAGFELKDWHFGFKMNANPLRKRNYDYRMHYDEECINIVNDIFKKDIEILEYEF